MRPARSATSSAAGSRPRKPRKHGAALGAESRGIVGAQRRPIGVADRPDGDARRPPECARPRVAARGGAAGESPRSLRSRAGDRRRGRRAWRRGWGRRPARGEVVDRPAHQPRRQAAAAVFARHQHHADPGEAAAIGQRRRRWRRCGRSRCARRRRGRARGRCANRRRAGSSALRARARRRRPAPTASATA